MAMLVASRRRSVRNVTGGFGNLADAGGLAQAKGPGHGRDGILETCRYPGYTGIADMVEPRVARTHQAHWQGQLATGLLFAAVQVLVPLAAFQAGNPPGPIVQGDTWNLFVDILTINSAVFVNTPVSNAAPW